MIKSPFSTTVSARSAARATPREWLGLAVLALPTLLLTLDYSVLFLALLDLSADLDPSSSQMLWITDIYGFMIAGFLVTMGTLGDRVGRRRLLLIGAAAFGVASVVAAFSTSPEMLIVTRALLGVAGATLMPSTLALIANMFRDPRQRSFAIGVWAASFSGGFVVGPVIGGLLLESFWWGSVFLMGVPVMVLLLVVGRTLLPEFRDPGAGRLDLSSVALSLAAILPVVYGVKQVAAEGLEGLPMLPIVVGVAFGVVFTRRQRRLAHPLLDLSLFSDRAFSAAQAMMLLGLGAMVGSEFFDAQYLQMVEGLSPFRAGVWMLPAVLAATAISLIAPLLARRVRPAHIMATGLAIAAVGLLVLTQVESTSGLPVLITGLVLAFTGLSPLMVLGPDLILGSAPPQRAGSASAMSETSGELGVALGVALLGSVGAAVYRDRAAESIPPETPPEVAGAAHDSLAGATGAAEQLPPAQAAELLESVREAFTAGLNTAAALGAALMIALAILAVTLLRQALPMAATSTTTRKPTRIRPSGSSCVPTRPATGRDLPGSAPHAPSGTSRVREARCSLGRVPYRRLKATLKA